MKDLTTLFSRRREWDWGLILTYDLNPITFFETQLLSKLNVRQNLTVVLDADNLRRLIEEDHFRPRFAGVYYNLEGVKIHGGGRFHPKLYLLAAEDEVWLAAGSFNLTETGFKKNLESLVELRFERDKLDADGASLLNEIADFLQQTFLNDNALIARCSECLRLSVKDLLSSPFFREVRERNEQRSKTCHFLSSINLPLVSQVITQTGQRRFKKIEALSPFYDDDASSIRQFKSITKQLDIYVPEKKSSLPASLFGKDPTLKNIPVYTVRLEENNFQRFCHAKMYRFHAERHAWTLLTSANLSGPGVVNASFPRNMETGFLFRDDKKSTFPGIPSIRTERVKNFADLNVGSQEDVQKEEGEGSQDGPRIVSAYYSNGLVRFSVVAHTESILSTHAVAELVLDERVDRAYAISDVGGLLQFEPELEIEGAKAIELILEARDGTWKTKPYPVGRRHHQPNQLPALGASAFHRCLQIGGLAGVAEAFRIAETSGREDWLLYLLAHWDLDRILNGLTAIEPASGTGNDELRIPSIRQRHLPDYSLQKLRTNLLSIVDVDILLEHFRAFSLSVIEQSGKDVLRNFTDYCFPLCVEIAWKFKQILAREEEKKRQDRYLCYPEYTWGNNFRKYLRFAKVIIDAIRDVTETSAWSLMENSDQRWLFSLHCVCWFSALHTDKTRREIQDEVRDSVKIEARVLNVFELLIADSRVSAESKERARELIVRYGASGAFADELMLLGGEIAGVDHPSQLTISGVKVPLPHLNHARMPR